MSNWRLTEAQTTVAAKRREIDVFNAEIGTLEGMLATARSFEGEYSERIGAIEGRMASLKLRGYEMGSEHGRPVLLGQKEAARRYEELEGELAAVQAERNREKAARTGPDGFCTVSVLAIEKKLRYWRTVRGVAQEELRNLEAKLTPGQLVQTGKPAPDYQAHRERVNALRASVGGGWSS